jgi:hypothetical protein
MLQLITTMKHGYSGYVRGCRCEICTEGKRLYNREYYRRPENAEKNRQKANRYREENPEKVKENQFRYYWANREDLLRKKALAGLHKKMEATALLGGKCKECGIADPRVLQFHHRDPAQKKFNLTVERLTSSREYSWSDIEVEIMKCDLLCANCHFIHHSSWTEEDIEVFRGVY